MRASMWFVALPFGLAMASSGCLEGPRPDSDTLSRLNLSHVRNSNGVEFERVVPTDTREPVSRSRPTPPISGGTLLITSDGRWAVASDPQRDRIGFVSIDQEKLLATLELEPGSEPGRLVQDETGVVHVVLRGAGAVVSVDPERATLEQRRTVCSAPRGIAAQGSLLHVACAEGKLVTLPLSGAEPVRVVDGLPNDLRDVVVRGDELLVSRFRSAQILRLSSDGTLLQALEAPRPVFERTKPTQPPAATFASRVAWRMIGAPSGRVVMVHQRAKLDPIDVSPPPETMTVPDIPYGGDPDDSSCPTGIVRSSITLVASDGDLTTIPVAGAALPVDIAPARDDQWFVASAAQPDLDAPNIYFVPTKPLPDGALPVVGLSAAVGIWMFSGTSVSVHDGETTSSCDQPALGFFEWSTNPVVAVAFSPARPNLVFAQTYDPAEIVLYDYQPDAGSKALSSRRAVPFGPEPIADTGHQLFHRLSPARLACASCHPEAGDDGSVWNLEEIGPRRTQALDVGLAGTEPLHWNGEHAGLAQLLDQTMVDRMGSARQSPERVAALKNWLFQRRVPPPPELDADSVARGKDLFFSSETECSSCHSGEAFTNNLTMDVGTGEQVQVPPLIGVGYRWRLMHDGCATSLQERFNPGCGGGDLHGKTSQLTSAEIADLVTYLRSL